MSSGLAEYQQLPYRRAIDGERINQHPLDELA